MERLTQDGNRLLWRRQGNTVCIEPWGPDVLRVRATVNPDLRDDRYALLDAADTTPEIAITDQEGIIRNGRIAARLGAERGVLRFVRSDDGEELLGEMWRDPFRPHRQWRCVGGDSYRAEVCFAGHADERLYGLGQNTNGRLDQKGCVVDLCQRNTEVSIPLLISDRMYGLLWHCPSQGRVELSPDRTRWIAEQTHQIDYCVIGGRSYADILARYADLTGHAPMLPDWATGFWQCKLRYTSQEELLNVAREHVKTRGLPMSVIVSDFYHWTKQGEWTFDPVHWPDPDAMVRELDEMGVRLMVSVWPTVNRNAETYEEMRDRGLLLGTHAGVPPQKEMLDDGAAGQAYVQFYDPSNPAARDYIWQRVRDGYYRHGIKIYWLDADEPPIAEGHFDNLRYHAGHGTAVSNLYALWHQQAFYDGLKSEGETEIITLSRSAWAGSQRYGAALWSGDIVSSWRDLREQVHAGLNVALSGIPWWTTDIGGFFHGDPDAEWFRELVVRWFQYGTFCPLFRLHGDRVSHEPDKCGDNEVWSYGDRAYEIMKGLLLLRERLRPYIMDQMRLASETGTPPMRPVFFDFPDDAGAYEAQYEFLFGPDLLVAPVVHEGADAREVYLPAGATWTDAWTDEALPGGQTVQAEAPLERIPLYLRDGAALPIRA
ncbi:MAG: family 31 glucosidase [Phycisphaerae bacterium]|nr:family 31 glucosidase [Phycisphaerae bacterium]